MKIRDQILQKSSQNSKSKVVPFWIQEKLEETHQRKLKPLLEVKRLLSEEENDPILVEAKR